MKPRAPRAPHLVSALLLAVCVQHGSIAADRLVAVRRGVEYLLASQNRDGSWGTARSGRPGEILAAVPGSLDAFRVGASALCVLALDGSPVERERCAAAKSRGLSFLLGSCRVRRPNARELYNVWAFAYSLQAIAVSLRQGDDEAGSAVARERAEALIDALGLYQTPDGGWGYYDFNAGTYRPSDSSMSFTTATVLLSLFEARESGLKVPEAMLGRGLRTLRSARKEDGSYIYGFYTRYRPGALYNRLKGSLGRTLACNAALRLFDRGVTDDDLRRGLDNLLRHHAMLDIARKRPRPHEAWYHNSGYYFYYGHYHARRVLDLLPGLEREKWRPRLDRILLERQEKDGSWWDFPLFSYHKAYGTAFALMALVRPGDEKLFDGHRQP